MTVAQVIGALLASLRFRREKRKKAADGIADGHQMGMPEQLPSAWGAAWRMIDGHQGGGGVHDAGLHRAPPGSVLPVHIAHPGPSPTY